MTRAVIVAELESVIYIQTKIPDYPEIVRTNLTNLNKGVRHTVYPTSINQFRLPTDYLNPTLGHHLLTVLGEGV